LHPSGTHPFPTRRSSDLGREPGQALLVHLSGDGEPVGGHHLPLRTSQRLRAELRVDRCGPERAGELTQPVDDDLGEDRPLLGHVALVRSDVTTGGISTDPQAHELADLLRQRHRGDESRRTITRGKAHVGPGPQRPWARAITGNRTACWVRHASTSLLYQRIQYGL